MPIPTPQEALDILKAYNKCETVIMHSISVCSYCCDIIEILEKKGKKVNIPLVVASALLHDICKLYTTDHVHAGADLLEELGYPEVADVIRRHGLKDIDQFPPDSIEAKIVFYADKRDEFSEIVPLEDRFECLKKRYGADKDWDYYYKKTKEIEDELLG